ncbi:T9SS type A sorting domain-containing protein [Candidatus Poribacteria bacterium]|nr:T9SS type A sorting domain-containing protein [Candidatus Poribacteria bacterium]
MKHIRSFFLVFLAYIAFVFPADAQQNIAQQAYLILERNCFNCHGPAGSHKEHIVIDSAENLVKMGAVVPRNPGASELYTRLQHKDPAKRMPLGQPALSPAAMAIIENWILQGAPSWDVQGEVVDFITTDAMLTSIQEHLKTLDAFDRPSARYFTMTHLYNAGEGPEALRAYQIALSKLINSLSWGFGVINPEPIDAAKTIFYIDLRDYEWDTREAWSHIEAVYPYTIEFNAEHHGRQLLKLTYLRGEMACEVPFVYVDWFLATASLPPLYHDILALPETEHELELELGIDVARNLRHAPGVRVWRAGTNDSGVSNHNRVVERHTSRYGAYWKSHDFDGSAGAKNIFTHPLSFERAGGEVIFNLPNGLQAYYISDAQGNRIDVAPTEIVSNPAASDPAVRNGISCIGCHTEGMKAFEDGVRSTIMQTANPGFDKAHALRLYVEKKVMDRLLAEDTDRYGEALKETGGVFDDIEPVSRFYEAFQGPLDASQAAAAIGMETEVFLAKIRQEPSLQNLGLTGLLTGGGGNVKRDVWESNFSDLVACVYGDECVAPPTPTLTPTPLPVFGHPIPDVNLRAAIAESLGETPASLTTEDIAKLRRLEADESGISDLRGLEYATRLERIELRRNAISDLSPLRNLTRLNNIKLRGNRITDVSPLGDLINVDWLGLEENAITDLRPLKKLIKLNGIGISGNPISDVSPLASLISLERIDAWRTPISDFSALAKLPRLRWIELGNDRSISKLPSLKGLKALRRLEIRDCSISDLSGLSALTQLEWLSLVNNAIVDVSPLANLTALKHLNLDANLITDASPLAKLARLEVLYLENNIITDVSGLSGFKNLERLDLRNNGISDFSPLEGLPDKTFVRMEGNPGFPSGGPKITGPWLWAIVPGTRLDDRTDFLSRATGGAATEIKVATNGAKEGKAVGKRKWALHRLSATEGNNINRMTDSLGWGTGEEIYDHIVYGSVVLDSPEEQETTMLVGSDDAVKVWLNGALVHKALVARGAGDYQDFFPVTLKQGKNVLLVALDNRGHGGFSGFFGFAPDAKYEVFQPSLNFNFSTDIAQIEKGDTFTVHLKVENAEDLAGWQTDIAFNSKVLRALRATEGDFLKQGDGRTFFQAGTINNTTGKITGIKTVQLSKGKMARQGTLFSVRFTALANGQSRLSVDNFQAGSSRGEKINATPPEITIVVGDGAPAAPSLRPDETVLLHNYPNPFNPETWIPYHLAEPADVTLRIYAASGVLVRTLALGHQVAGIYQGRSRAAYWDGKNDVGESVASGIYFYTLTAGDFTATRKMLIRK